PRDLGLCADAIAACGEDLEAQTPAELRAGIDLFDAGRGAASVGKLGVVEHLLTQRLGCLRPEGAKVGALDIGPGLELPASGRGEVLEELAPVQLQRVGKLAVFDGLQEFE